MIEVKDNRELIVLVNPDHVVKITSLPDRDGYGTIQKINMSDKTEVLTYESIDSIWERLTNES